MQTVILVPLNNIELSIDEPRRNPQSWRKGLEAW